MNSLAERNVLVGGVLGDDDGLDRHHVGGLLAVRPVRPLDGGRLVEVVVRVVEEVVRRDAHRGVRRHHDGLRVEVGVVVAVRPVERVGRHVARVEHVREELERLDDGLAVLRWSATTLPSSENTVPAEGEQRHLEVVDGVGRAGGLGHADPVDLGVLGRVLLAERVLGLRPVVPVAVPVHGDLGGIVVHPRLLQQVPPVVDVHGLGTRWGRRSTRASWPRCRSTWATGRNFSM